MAPPTEPTWLDTPLDPYPATLSEVGLYDDVDSATPSARAIPYWPAWPLWTNGSKKSRFVTLPDGETVDNSAEQWNYPAGTVFFKTFAYGSDATELALASVVVEQSRRPSVSVGIGRELAVRRGDSAPFAFKTATETRGPR